jgi:hypothetical protein
VGEAGPSPVGAAEAAPAFPERFEVLGQLEWDGFLQAPVLEVLAMRASDATSDSEANEKAAVVGTAALES